MRVNRLLWFAALIAAVLFIPWLGDTYFYSKGEPREAIVAVTMLETGNWCLPVSYGCDIPYKPPLLAWLISICSMVLNHGIVNEFTSRLPSALAAVGLAAATWQMVRRYAGDGLAWMTMLVMITSFEFFRAATACRVDMVLTACMVGGIYGMLTMGRSVWRWSLTVFLLSGAVLAKGPVGVLLPCLATGIYFILRRENVFVVVGKMSAICILASLLPAWWYYEAWQQGGDLFLNLAYEENIGRLTGSMSYESHVNPWWYNVTSVLSGLLPWTIPFIAALCTRRFRTGLRAIHLGNGWPLACIAIATTIFLFYCIPASKRSVYLLPCYPFMCYGIAWTLHRVGQNAVARVWAVILAIIAIVGPLFFIAASCHLTGPFTVAPLHWWLWPIAVMPVVVGVWWLCTRAGNMMRPGDCTILTMVILVAYNAAYMPMVLNPRSDVHVAKKIESIVPAEAPIVTYIPQDSLLRYYSLNFYLGDRLRRIEAPEDAPANAYILTSSADNGQTVRSMVQPDTLALRSSDTRRPILLYRPAIQN